MTGGDYDLVIVGGGLVGGSLALALAHSSLRVAVVEAQSPVRRQVSPAGQRALALARGSAQILEQLGVWSDIAPHAMPIRHIHVSDRGHFGKTRIGAEEEGVAALGYVATATRIEEAIAEALRTAPVDHLCPATLVGLGAGPDRIHVILRRGEKDVDLTARLVVGADGTNSSVRRSLSIPQTVTDYGQTAIVTEALTELDHRNTAYERFTPSGPLAFLPIGRKRCSVVWTLKPPAAQALLSVPESEFLADLQAAFGTWLGDLRLASRLQSFPLQLIQSASMTHERVVLIGNAVHQLHPVAGQGFNLGLRDAAQLAEMLIIRTSFGEDLGDADFLARYAASRRRDLDQVIFFTDSLVRLFSNAFPPLALARNIGLLALDSLPAAKRFLARQAMGLGRRIPRFS